MDTWENGIQTEEEYNAALVVADKLMNAERDTPSGERLNAIVTMIEAYEARHWRISCESAREV